MSEVPLYVEGRGTKFLTLPQKQMPIQSVATLIPGGREGHLSRFQFSGLEFLFSGFGVGSTSAQAMPSGWRCFCPASSFINPEPCTPEPDADPKRGYSDPKNAHQEQAPAILRGTLEEET